MSNAAPGWYPVEGDDRRRYWDGQTWTEHYEELPTPTTAESSTPTYAAPTTALASTKPGMSVKKKALIGAGAFVLFFGIIGAVFGDDAPEDVAAPASSSKSSATSAAKASTPAPKPTALSASDALTILGSAPQPKNPCTPTAAETQALMAGLATHEETQPATIHVKTFLGAGCETVKQEAAAAAQQAATKAAEAKAAAKAAAKAKAAAAAAAKAKAAITDPKTYKALDKRALAKVVKNPEAYVGKKYAIFAEVTQFDSVTGGERFRADVAYKDIREYGYWIGGENSMIDAGAADISDVINGDIVKMYVVVSGVETYETTMGGNITVPVFEVNILKVIGSSD